MTVWLLLGLALGAETPSELTSMAAPQRPATSLHAPAPQRLVLYEKRALRWQRRSWLSVDQPTLVDAVPGVFNAMPVRGNRSMLPNHVALPSLRVARLGERRADSVDDPAEHDSSKKVAGFFLTTLGVSVLLLGTATTTVLTAFFIEEGYGGYALITAPLILVSIAGGAAASMYGGRLMAPAKWRERKAEKARKDGVPAP